MYNKGMTKVEKQTMDRFIQQQKECIPGLIKADIEGDEIPFLYGAKNTIAKYRPILLISIYHNPEQFFKMKPLIESWNLDYHMMIRKLSPATLVSETTLICIPKELL